MIGNSKLSLAGAAAMLALATLALPGTAFAQETDPDGQEAAACVQNRSGDPEFNTTRNQLACGDLAEASGISSTAIGINATARGHQSTATGRGSGALGDSSTAMGVESGAEGNSSTAIGSSAKAYVENASAFGANSRASATNSVALGQGSVADRDNSVSVGGLDNNDVLVRRQITNVAAATEGTDAVNLDQMNAGDAATLMSANVYTDMRETAIRADIEAGGAATLASANAYADAGDARVEGIANAAQSTADTAIERADALGDSAAAALGGGAAYNAITGAVSAPSYEIGGQRYDNVGSAFAAVDSSLDALDTRVDALSASSDRRFRQGNGGIATALALGGAMIVPDSTVSVNFNLATYRGEQGFSGAVAVRAARRVYISGGFAGSTVKGSTGGRVGVAFGF